MKNQSGWSLVWQRLWGRRATAPQCGPTVAEMPGTAAAGAAAYTLSDRHLGMSAWGRDGTLYALCYPDRLLSAPSGIPADLQERFRFDDRPLDARGLFINSRGHIFVGLKGHGAGQFGRTYVSTDLGATFSASLGQCFWAMDEDARGNLFAGIYHERGEPDMACMLYWSADGGASWTDLAPGQWSQQLHVHHLAVNPHTGWLYATLGDTPGMNGCWRSKLTAFELRQAACRGDSTLVVASTAGLVTGDELCLPGSGVRTIGAAHVDRIVLTDPLGADLPAATLILKSDWSLCFADENNRSQYCGLCFAGDDVFLADDNGPGRNPERVLVYRAHDDGSDTCVSPEAVLTAGKASGWGAFFLERDRFGAFLDRCPPGWRTRCALDQCRRQRLAHRRCDPQRGYSVLAWYPHFPRRHAGPDRLWRQPEWAPRRVYRALS